MAKTQGGTRTLKPGSRAYNASRAEADDMLASGAYSSVEFDMASGGYVAIEKSPARHKPEELECANMLASKGYKVILKDESTRGKTPDGYVFAVAFEQRTPNGGTGQNFKKALDHVAEKPDAEVAVIYMKEGRSTHTRQTVVEGLKLFEAHRPKRFKDILVVTDKGHIHRHKHNDEDQ